MKVVNSTGLEERPPTGFDQSHSRAPWLWYDERALDGTIWPWLDAPIGSMYWYLSATEVTIYVKVTNGTDAAAWDTLVRSSSDHFVRNSLAESGTTTYFDDVVVTGTLTVGDVVASDSISSSKHSRT